MGGVADFEVVDIGLYSGEYVSLGVKKTETKVEPVFREDGSLEKVKILVKANANIEQTSGEVDVTNDEVRRELEQKLNQAEISRIMAALARSIELDTDFMQIGKKIELKHPVKFSKIKDQWEDVFRSVEFEVSARAEIDRTYDISNMPNMNGET